ncbi:unnamed protein product, partial [marine sediment metagenome]
MFPENNKWLAKALLDKKIITPDQLTQALDRERENNETLEKVLVDLSFVRVEELIALKKKESIYDEKSLLGHVDPEVLKLVPEQVARR